MGAQEVQTHPFSERGNQNISARSGTSGGQRQGAPGGALPLV